MIEEELVRISNMDEHQILLKARNFTSWKGISKENFIKLRDAIDNRLKIYGYTLVPSCCGKFSVTKL